MPVATALSKVGRFDFFAILAPGFYLVVTSSLFLTAWLTHGETLGMALPLLSQIIKTNWPLAVAILVLAYMLGGLLRAISPSDPDILVCKVLKNFRLIRDPARDQKFSGVTKSFVGLTYHSEFPYVSVLKIEQELLRNSGVEFPLPTDDAAHVMFNHWKLMLCHHSPAAFELAQEREGRVRLFSGIVMATVPCGLLGAVGTVLSFIDVFHQSWLPLMASITVVSWGFAGLHGWRLRRVRVAEVLTVFHGAAVLSQSMANTKEKEEGRP